MLCEFELGNISLAIPDNRDISFAIERIIDFSRSIGIHYITGIKEGSYKDNLTVSTTRLIIEQMKPQRSAALDIQE